MKAPDPVRAALDGLSTGDALGAALDRQPFEAIRTRTLPPGPWRWGDATVEACATLTALDRHHDDAQLVIVPLVDGQIDTSALAAALAADHRRAPWRAPVDGSAPVIARLADGHDPHLAVASMACDGNAAAARGVIVGAAHPGAPARAAAEARRAAMVTHAALDAQAGAMAVAAAAALAAHDPPDGDVMLESIVPHVPAGPVRDALEAARRFGRGRPAKAARVLGAGQRRRALDTVPLALWIAAWHRDYAEAIWHVAAAMGDRSTLCALVGGLVGLISPPPTDWLDRREALPTRLATRP